MPSSFTAYNYSLNPIQIIYTLTGQTSTTEILKPLEYKTITDPDPDATYMVVQLPSSINEDGTVRVGGPNFDIFDGQSIILGRYTDSTQDSTNQQTYVEGVDSKGTYRLIPYDITKYVLWGPIFYGTQPNVPLNDRMNDTGLIYKGSAIEKQVKNNNENSYNMWAWIVIVVLIIVAVILAVTGIFMVASKTYRETI